MPDSSHARTTATRTKIIASLVLGISPSHYLSSHRKRKNLHATSSRICTVRVHFSQIWKDGLLFSGFGNSVDDQELRSLILSTVERPLVLCSVDDLAAYCIPFVPGAWRESIGSPHKFAPIAVCLKSEICIICTLMQPCSRHDSLRRARDDEGTK